jgi:hypothetical protein
MHIWVVLTREHEDESVCGFFFSSINEGLGWHRFESLGRRERGWNTGVDLLDHSYSLGVYSPSTLPKRQLCGGIREGNRDCDAEEVYPKYSQLCHLLFEPSQSLQTCLSPKLYDLAPY